MANKGTGFILDPFYFYLPFLPKQINYFCINTQLVNQPNSSITEDYSIGHLALSQHFIEISIMIGISDKQNNAFVITQLLQFKGMYFSSNACLHYFLLFVLHIIFSFLSCLYLHYTLQNKTYNDRNISNLFSIGFIKPQIPRTL